MSALLAALERAARQPPGPGQLGALLDAWRLVPSPRLFGLIDELSRRFALPALGGRAAWIAAAQDRRPEALPSLLDGLVAAPWADFGLLAQLLDGDPDPRLVAAERRLYQKFKNDIRLVESMLERHRRAPADLPADALPLVDRIAIDVNGLADVEARLRADVFADPRDDVARMVYADYLQELGDPRGELIALQLARAPGTEGRMKELEQRLFSRCLGALQHTVTSGRLERGFVVEATVGYNAQAFAAVVDRPDWATVRILTLANVHRPAVVTALLDNPALAHLEQLYGVAVESLAKATGALVALRRLGLEDRDDEGAFARLRAEAFPALTEIRAAGEGLVRAIQHCPLAPQLERLEVSCFPPALPLCLLEHTLARCTLVVTAMREVATLRDRVLHTRGIPANTLAQMLDAMPANTFREIHVAERLEHADDARLARSAGRHGGLRMEQRPA